MVIDANIVKRHIRPKADSTLMNMKKADLIEYVRTLEHNYNVAVSFNEQQARNIETMIKNGDIPLYWNCVEDEKPLDFVSVLGHMTDAGDFPPVRECYKVGNVFFFPALQDIHPIDKWSYMPEPPEVER